MLFRSRGGRRGSAVEEVDVDVRAGLAPDPAWSRQRRKTSSSPPRSDWRGGDHGVLRWLALPLGGCCQRRKKRRKRRRRQGRKEERTRVRRRGSGLGFIGEKGSGVGGRRRGDDALAGGQRRALSARTRTTARTVIGPGGPRPGAAGPKGKAACGQVSSFSSLSPFLFPQIF